MTLTYFSPFDMGIAVVMVSQNTSSILPIHILYLLNCIPEYMYKARVTYYLILKLLPQLQPSSAFGLSSVKDDLKMSSW